ncbi:MAG TPA: hypothetical protein P5313_11080 [Spirochaetia bacterium]|nr:hypothetical protein [Spirochaetales bacterium]HRY80948.1 hypothetical protein [Spirochaetia bacterium]
MNPLKRSYPALLLAIALALPSSRAAAQAFGFGTEPSPEDPAAAPARAALPVEARGTLSLGALLFPEDLSDPAGGKPEDASLLRLDLIAEGNAVQAELRLRIGRSALEEATAAGFLDEAVDEAYLRLFLGTVTLEGGIRKVAWGKADSQGPLDVLNPFDYTDMTVTDDLERKIARPLLRAVWAAAPKVQVEAVFLPAFEPHAVDFTGRWQPAAVRTLLASGYTGFSAPDTDGLDYAQAGARLAATSGSLDWGLQYFYGYLPTPSYDVSTFPTVTVLYNRYQQFGADLAAVFGGFGVRAELAANLTEDLPGDDPLVYNPRIAFSLGADRGIGAGINVNLQYAGTVRLLDGGVTAPTDVDSGTDAFASTLTAVASQKLLRDKLEWRLAALWSPSDEDFLLIPSLSWTEGDAEVKLAAGIFGGDPAGQMGQYADASWVRLTLTYAF